MAFSRSQRVVNLPATVRHYPGSAIAGCVCDAHEGIFEGIMNSSGIKPTGSVSAAGAAVVQGLGLPASKQIIPKI